MTHNTNHSKQTHNDTTSITTQVAQSSIDIPTNSILGLSALSFLTGITSSAWYAHRKGNNNYIFCQFILELNLY